MIQVRFEGMFSAPDVSGTPLTVKGKGKNRGKDEPCVAVRR